MTVPYHKTITYQLAAAVANGIAQSQTGTAGTALTLNGSLVSGGVATLDSGGAARRVLLTPAADESAHTFTITGTDRNGRPQTEVLTGSANPTTAQSLKDFLTVSKIVPNNTTTGAVVFGTNSVGSSAPYILDMYVNPANYGVSTVVAGTVNYTIEKSSDDLAPAYDLTLSNPTWYPSTSFTAQTTNVDGIISGPCTMIRLTINSGTGDATARIITSLMAGPF